MLPSTGDDVGQGEEVAGKTSVRKHYDFIRIVLNSVSCSGDDAAALGED